MAGELDAALAKFDTLIATITGFNTEPSTVPTAYSGVFPFFVIEPDSGRYIKESSGQVKALHNVSIQIHFALPSTITPSDRSEMRKYADLIKDKLFLDANATLTNTIDTIVESIDYTVGQIGFRGIPTIGLEMIVPIKIKSIESSGAYIKG